MLYLALSISKITSEPMNRVSAPVCTCFLILPPPVQPPLTTLLISIVLGLELSIPTRSITAAKCAWAWPGCAPPNSLNYILQVLLHTHSITASKGIPESTGSWPPSASHNPLDQSLQVRTANCLQTHSIVASKCISYITWLRPASLHHQWPPTHLITASGCVSKFAQSDSPSSVEHCPPNSLDYDVQVTLPTLSITIS